MREPFPGSPGGTIVFDPRLAEAAVLGAIERRPASERLQFRAERDCIYEYPEADSRETAFAGLHERWFSRLGLGDPVRSAIDVWPLIAGRISVCMVLPAGGRKDEHGDLVARRDGRDEGNDCRPALWIRLCASSLFDRDDLLAFLHHELGYVSDMLDPQFGYNPAESSLGRSPLLENLVRRRYRAAWDATISGRLVTRGLSSPADLESRLKAFLVVFPMLGARAADAFGRFSGGAGTTHAELLRFATDPLAWDGIIAETGEVEICPLCRFPTRDFAEAHQVPDSALHRIRRDFPDWNESQRICRQCRDLMATEAKNPLAQGRT